MEREGVGREGNGKRRGEEGAGEGREHAPADLRYSLRYSPP